MMNNGLWSDCSRGAMIDISKIMLLVYSTYICSAKHQWHGSGITSIDASGTIVKQIYELSRYLRIDVIEICSATTDLVIEVFLFERMEVGKSKLR